MENAARYSNFVDAWKRAIFPARPSSAELQLFDFRLQGCQGQKMLIMGSTPELRDLGHKNKLQITCADLNPDMLHGMRKLMHSTELPEELVVCNWLKMPFQDNSFDVILSEQSLTVLPLEHWEQWLKEVARVLKPSGKAMIKVFMRLNGKEEDVLQIFKKRNSDISYLKAKILSSLLEKDVVPVSQSIEYATDLFKEDKITKQEYDSFLYHFEAIGKGNLYLYCMDKNKFEELANSYFNIIELVYGKDLELHRQSPIYVFGKK